MADSRRYGLTPQLDIGQILLEAQHRWLRPTEVCEILRNYKKFRLAPDPPHKPAGGSLFLFDRKALRYFRKDGLNWRKKKDGKTVREAHERLKAGSIDVLHCYYAHGEDNENFQRRCYWMLDEQYEHIVLVHYREVKEGNKGGSLRSVNTERGLQTTNSLGHLTTSSSSNQVHTSSLLAQTTYASSPSTSEWNGPTRSSEYEEGESAEDVGAAVSVEGESSSAEQGSILRKPNENDDFVVDSRGYQPQTYLKTFTNLQADNEMSYVPINANEVGPEQYSFLGLKQPVQGHFSKQIDGSQFRVPFPNTSLVLYGNRENASLGLSQGDYTGRQMFSPGVTSHLSGSNDLVMQTKNVTISGNKINNNGHDNHTSTPWTEALELCRSGILNNAEETKLPSLQSATGEDILRRQTNVAMETFVSSELGGGQQSYTDAHLQALMGSHKFMSNTPQSSVDQQQIAGLGCGSLNVLHRNNGLLKDLEQLQEPSHQQTNQQRKPQTQNDGNAILLRKEYLEKHEAENDIKLEENPVYSRILRQTSQECSLEAEDQGGLKKMDSFGRWMSREICGDVEDSLVASDSGMYWNTLDGQNGVEEVSSLSRQIQLDADLLEPSLSQDQLFSISDFSPDWAYTDVDTKVLITGTFMGRSKNIYKYKLSCMFGEIEVAAEVLGPGVLRCQAPHHSPGRVPFYVTSSNRLACSEVREFEYRAGPSQDMITSSRMDNEAADEMLLQIRFAKLLSLNFDKAQIHSTTSEGENCRSSKLCSLMKEIAEEWLEMERSTKESAPDCDKTRAQLMKNLLKEKLFAWLLWKINDEGKGPNVLDDKGQGAIHLAAALGYDWALGPIVSAGVSGNFRDIHGWTALHWAANYGREQAVSTLITLGAAPGALTDPSPKFHDGRTPADLASSRGHKGIAGYLAESSLTIHLSNLSINENIMGSVSATLAGEKAVETVAERSVVQLEEGGREDQLALKDSLAAVRNAAQAAARIQAAFRVHSFRRRQVTKYGDDKCGMSDEKALSFISVQRTSKSGNHDEPLHAAAIRIQRKFRGWKGRKEFLIIRQRIVKIQAHVRGHQVRKNYRKIIWSVGIVEKAILRWRRKGVGLRGFRAEGAIEGSEAQKGEQNENDDYDFLRDGRKQMEAGLEKALARVQSMVQYPEARDQYRRLVASSQDKVDNGGTSDWKSQNSNDSEINEEDQDVLMSITD